MWEDDRPAKKEEGPERKKSLRHAYTIPSLSSERSYRYLRKFATTRFPRRPHASECRHAVSLARFSVCAVKVSVENVTLMKNKCIRIYPVGVERCSVVCSLQIFLVTNLYKFFFHLNQFTKTSNYINNCGNKRSVEIFLLIKLIFLR